MAKKIFLSKIIPLCTHTYIHIYDNLSDIGEALKICLISILYNTEYRLCVFALGQVS